MLRSSATLRAAAVGDYKWLSGCSAGVILLVGLTTYMNSLRRASAKKQKQGKGATKCLETDGDCYMNAKHFEEYIVISVKTDIINELSPSV